MNLWVSDWLVSWFVSMDLRLQAPQAPDTNREAAPPSIFVKILGKGSGGERVIGRARAVLFFVSPCFFLFVHLPKDVLESMVRLLSTFIIFYPLLITFELRE